VTKTAGYDNYILSGRQGLKRQLATISATAPRFPFMTLKGIWSQKMIGYDW
jgi:hypothetical protein